MLVVLLTGAACSDQKRPDAIGSSASSSEPPTRLEVLVSNDDAVDAAVQWLEDHRTELSNRHGAPTTVDNLNVPTCTSGSVRGQVVATADTTAPLSAALQPADCTSTAAAPSTDVAAFDVGFATL